MNVSRIKSMSVAGVLLLSLIAAIAGSGSPARGDAPVARHDPDPNEKPQRVVFVVDSSENLAGRIGSLQAQLTQAIDGLEPSQSFGMLTFSGMTFRSLSVQPKQATPDFKANAKGFIQKMQPKGDSHPTTAMELAFQEKPDLIYLIVGGDFTEKDRLLAKAKEYSAAHRVRMNPILFYNKPPPADLTKTLQTLARQSGGVYKQVDSTKLDPAPTTGPTTAP